MTDTRIERDCLGEMEIPNDRYYGIQTTRMVKVSGAAGYPVIAYPDMHIALCKIKKACALANAEVGALKPEIAQAIVQACDKVITGGYDLTYAALGPMLPDLFDKYHLHRKNLSRILTKRSFDF